MSEQMETVWQQAEMTAGLADEVARRARALRNEVRADPPNEKRDAVPTRGGLLGAIDATTETLRQIRQDLEAIALYIGEHGVAPTVSASLPRSGSEWPPAASVGYRDTVVDPMATRDPRAGYR